MGSDSGCAFAKSGEVRKTYQGPKTYVLSQGPFPPLNEVRVGLQVNWYRCKTPKGALTELARSDAQGLFQSVGHFSIWLATGALVSKAWHSGHLLAFCGALFFHGTVGSTLVYGCHEMGHGTVFKSPSPARSSVACPEIDTCDS